MAEEQLLREEQIKDIARVAYAPFKGLIIAAVLDSRDVIEGDQKVSALGRVTQLVGQKLALRQLCLTIRRPLLDSFDWWGRAAREAK